MRPRSPARSPSKPLAGRCAVREPRHRSGRARTASSPGCSGGPSVPITSRYPGPANPSAPSWTATPRSTPRSIRARRRSTWPGGCASGSATLTRSRGSCCTPATTPPTPFVIGTGSWDPQKFDPDASRETLDHSLPYIFAVALQDGSWHHERSYAPERAHRRDTVELWHKICTVEDPEWTRRYHSNDAADKAFGARAGVTLKSGEVICDELAVADAHPLGARPFEREQYIGKFTRLADEVVDPAEQQRFLDAVQRVRELKGDQLGALNVRVLPEVLDKAPTIPSGIFR